MTLIRSSVAAMLLTATAVIAQPPAVEKGKAPATSQPKAPAKTDLNSLEALIADALKSHPDLRVAEAKVRDAEAALNQTRFQIIRQVTTAYTAAQEAKSTLKAAELLMDYHTRLREKSATTVSELELQKARLEVERARSEVAKHESELNLLVGRAKAQQGATVFWELAGREMAFGSDGRWLATGMADGTVQLWDPATGKAISSGATGNAAWGDSHYVAKVPPGTMSERIRAALAKPIRIEGGKQAMPLTEAIEMLQKKGGADIPIRVLPTVPRANTVELMAGELPLSAWLQMIEDSIPELRFVVREYGILATTRDRRPEDAMPLGEFRRRTEPKPKEEEKKE
jgi:hypothetical protein